MNDQQIKQLKKAYEPLRGKKISTDKAMKLSAMVDKLPKDSLVKIYKSDIPFVSTSALTTLMIKHNFKASDLKEGKKELDRWKKSGGEERFLKGAKAAREIIKKLEKGMNIKKHRRESVELDESLESDLTSLSKSGTIQITQGNAQTRSDFYKVLKPFKKWGKSWKRGDKIQIQMGKLVKESVLEEKNVPTNPKLWAKFKAQAKAKFDVYPSAYANGWAAKQYKAAGGGWKTESVKESVELDEGFTPKEIKMAIGIASDRRYAGGNMTGAVNQIEKIKKGLSKHKQVAAVLRRQNESVEKIECPKCDGKGCSHCDDKGYHLKEGYLLEKVGSVKTPYGTVEIKKNPRAGRNQDGYIMVLHGKTKKHYLGSHPNPDDSSVNNIVKNAFKSGWLKEEVELEEKIEYIEYKFKNKNDAQKALNYFKSQQLIKLDINDDGLSYGELAIDAGKKDMTKYHKEIMKKYRPKVLTQESVEYIEYKFKNKNDAMSAKKMLDGIQLMSFDINDDNISGGELAVDAGKKDMTKYHKEIMKKYRPKVLTQESVELEERNKELDYMIQRFKGVIDPDYEGDEDPDDILADIKKKFGSKVYNDLKKGQDKIHFGRPNHKRGIDRLADRKKTPSTKSGKADKRSIKALKSRIKFDRSMKSRKEETEIEEGKKIDRALRKYVPGHAKKTMRSRWKDNANDAYVGNSGEKYWMGKDEEEYNAYKKMRKSGERGMKRYSKLLKKHKSFYKEEVELEEKKSVTQQIQDIERMLDRTRGNTSAVKMKRYALKKKLDKLMSMKEEVELEENIIPKGVKLGQKPSKKGHHPDSWVILKLNGRMFGSNSKIVKILKPTKNAPDPEKHGGDAAKRLYILKTTLDKAPESPIKKKFLQQLGEETMTTNSGVAGLGKDGPADFFLKKRKNLVTKRYIEVNGKLKRREK